MGEMTYPPCEFCGHRFDEHRPLGLGGTYDLFCMHPKCGCQNYEGSAKKANEKKLAESAIPHYAAMRVDMRDNFGGRMPPTEILVGACNALDKAGRRVVAVVPRILIEGEIVEFTVLHEAKDQ